MIYVYIYTYIISTSKYSCFLSKTKQMDFIPWKNRGHETVIVQSPGARGQWNSKTRAYGDWDVGGVDGIRV